VERQPQALARLRAARDITYWVVSYVVYGGALLDD